MVDDSNSDVNRTKEKTQMTDEIINQTLAQQIAADEHQMYLRSQQHLHEIEDEVNFF